MLDLRAGERARSAEGVARPRAVAGEVVVAITTLFGAEFVRAAPSVILWQLPQIGALTVPLQLAACAVPFALPFAVASLAARHGAREVLVVCGIVLGAVRMGAQLAGGDARALLVLAGMAAFLVGFSSAVASIPRAVPVGVLAGLTADALIRGVTVTRDLLWIEGLVATGATAAIFVVLLSGLRTLRDADLDRRAGGAALVALGPLLVLELLVLQNQGWVAELGGVTPVRAFAVIMIANTAGFVAMVTAPSGPGRSLRLALPAGAAVLTLGIVAPARTTWLPLVVVAGQVGVAVLLPRLVSSAGSSDRARGTPLAMGLTIIPIAIGLYHAPAISDAVVSPRLVLIAIAVLVVVPGLRVAHPDTYVSCRPPTATVVTIPLLVAFVLVHLMATTPSIAGTAPRSAQIDDLTVATFNVRRGFTTSGELNVLQVADVLAAHDVDVVGLQEVPRGMLLTNGIDAVAWLAHRLGLPHVAFQSSATLPTYGTAILSRYPIQDVRLDGFRDIGRDATRGMAAASVLVPDQPDLLFVTSHLEPGPGHEIRASQAAAIIEFVRDHPRTVVAGDLNAGPGTEPVDLLVNAALQPVEINALTYPAASPDAQLDWVFHAEDVVVLEANVPASGASDHLPIIVRLAWWPPTG
jgi:endonuclease/exonuclease/phosphatase family metal-dependent hydrolase